MQLRIKILGFLFLLSSATISQGQNDKNSADRSWFKKNAFTEIEIDILSSYYEQSGNHSAVLGGTGTEKLTDVTPKIIVNVPLDSSKQVSVSAGIDFYSSASTDNIDDKSSASGQDSRQYVDVTYTQQLPYLRETFSVTLGNSKEYGVSSFSLGASWSKESKNGNREISFSSLVYLDKWKLYIPKEFRVGKSGDGKETDNRNSFTFGVNYAQVLTRRLQASFSAEIVYQNGMLSTPFHRVYFDDGVNVIGFTEKQLINSSKLRKVEQLPSGRLKIPFGARLNYYLSDFLVIRSNVRHYNDDFGVSANNFIS